MQVAFSRIDPDIVATSCCFLFEYAIYEVNEEQITKNKMPTNKTKVFSYMQRICLLFKT